MKKILFISIVFLGLVVALAVLAKPNFEEATNPAGHTLAIPDTAVQVGANVFYLGKAFDPGTGKMVEGYAFIHGKKDFAKPSGCKDDGVCQGWESASCADCGGGPAPETSTCYGFLSKGAKWKNNETWVVNPANSNGLTASFVLSNLMADIKKWEDAANYDILGNGSVTGDDLSVDYGKLNDKNEVYFGNLGSSGTIAVTYVWGIFTGKPAWRELVEWDQIYNAQYAWSEDCKLDNCVAKMDFENIATHELGHSVGMDDLYNSACSKETMYGYADFGEIKKRSLEPGDIFGVKELYK